MRTIKQQIDAVMFTTSLLKEEINSEQDEQNKRVLRKYLEGLYDAAETLKKVKDLQSED